MNEIIYISYIDTITLEDGILSCGANILCVEKIDGRRKWKIYYYFGIDFATSIRRLLLREKG